MHEAARLLGRDLTLDDNVIRVLDDYLGPGYAAPSIEGMNAIRLAARHEGLLLDPCYTGKGMAGVIDLAKREFHAGQNIVFVHTGGLPGIFSYSRELSTQHTMAPPG